MGDFLDFATGILPLLVAGGFAWFAMRGARQPILYLLAAAAALVQVVTGTVLTPALRTIVAAWVIALAHQYYTAARKGA